MEMSYANYLEDNDARDFVWKGEEVPGPNTAEEDEHTLNLQLSVTPIQTEAHVAKDFQLVDDSGSLRLIQLRLYRAIHRGKDDELVLSDEEKLIIKRIARRNGVKPPLLVRDTRNYY